MLMAITVSAAAFTSGVLSSPNYSLNTDGIKYLEKTTSENGSKQNIFYGEYNSTVDDADYEWVIHSVRDGNTTTLTNVLNIAKDYESTTGRKVMLAVNADFFYDSGENVDTYVSNGVVLKQGNMTNKHCIGFDNNGKVAMGRMTETETRLMIYDNNGDPVFYEIEAFNSAPSEGGIAIYNTPGTYTVYNAGATVVKTSSTNLTSYPVWGNNYTLSNKGVKETNTFTVKDGQFVIVYTAEHNSIFKNYTAGKEMNLVEVPAGDFAGCTWVVGGYDMLVNNGVVGSNFHTDNSGNANAPRTFFGFKADGTGFVCVVDGRYAGGSVGITVTQEAQLASVLGAKYALELDGGGSSTMVVRVNDTLTKRNTPSDGSMRLVSNAILLVEKVHECESKCETCGNCLDSACTKDACTNKCQGHHSCTSICPVAGCGKCLDTSCKESACTVKCPGHHSCESICPKCGKCLDNSCSDSACIDKCQGHHECESICPKCDKCLDDDCTDPVCVDKCQGHHSCSKVCAKCGKCLDKKCTDPACADKCQGHHVCTKVCAKCGKCLDKNCTDPVCADKCQGHHVCTSLCSKCGKCLNDNCTKPACAEKCEGHDDTNTPSDPGMSVTPSEPTTPDTKPSKDNSFVALIRSIIEAIRKFFMNLFS